MLRLGLGPGGTGCRALGDGDLTPMLVFVRGARPSMGVNRVGEEEWGVGKRCEGPEKGPGSELCTLPWGSSGAFYLQV